MNKKTVSVNGNEQKSLSDRFKSELARTGLSYGQVSAITGVSKNSVGSWARGAKIPAEALAALMPHGLDVWYVLGGRRKDAPQPVLLTPEEAVFLDEYRSLSDELREAVRAQVTAWHEKAVRDGAGGVRVRERKPPPESRS